MEISLAAEQIGHLGPLPITNSMLLSWIVSIGLILATTFSLRNLKSVPTGIQNFFETIVEALFNLANSILDDEKATKKYFALVATIFIFIVTNNWIGLVPGVGSIGIHEGEKFVPLLRGANADLNTTLALAVVAVIAIQIFGVAAIGTFKYAKKFINFNGPINFFIGIIELISEFAKMISFSFRLFGNIFAGEVLLTIVAFLVPLIAPLPFFALELFVGAVQALVFSMLVLVFIKMAITEVSH
jgi:F-type H+-transporting ATPase subunit a